MEFDLTQFGTAAVGAVGSVVTALINQGGNGAKPNAAVQTSYAPVGPVQLPQAGLIDGVSNGMLAVGAGVLGLLFLVMGKK
jgi:hypothetical protein